MLQKRTVQNKEIDKFIYVKDVELKSFIEKIQKQTFDLKDLHDLKCCCESQDIQQMHLGAMGIRKILSQENSPIQEIIDGNFIQDLIRFIQKDEYPHLQYESAWALTNIASGTTKQVYSIIDSQGIQHLIKLLHNNHEFIQEQSMWVLGNIAADSYELRDLILKTQALQIICKIVYRSTNINLIQQGAIIISILCSGKPKPQYKYVSVAIPVLIKLLSVQEDEEILNKCLWSICRLSDSSEEVIQYIIDMNILPSLNRCLELNILHLDAKNIQSYFQLQNVLEIQCQEVTVLSLQFLFQYQIFNEPNLICKLLNHLFNQKQQIKKQTCWAISHLLTQQNSIFEYFIKNQKFLETIYDLILNDQKEVQLEALWIFSNIVRVGNESDVFEIIDQYIYNIINITLLNENDELVDVCLDIIKSMMEFNQHQNLIIESLQQKQIFDFIDEMQNKKHFSIPHKACQIISVYRDYQDNCDL